MNEKAQAVVDAAQGELGAPYVYGAWGGLCTPAYRRQYLGYNPSHTAIKTNCPVLSEKQASCDGCKYNGKRAYDCRGFLRWVFEQIGLEIAGQGASSQYNTGTNWARRGPIADMPDLVCAVYQVKAGTTGSMSHTGVHIGGGRIIHCSVEVKEGSTADRGWSHYAIPKGLYTDDEINEAGAIPMSYRRGDQGDGVRALQETLNLLGYDCGKVDGKFGAKTEAAVRDFQNAWGLAVDGVVGPDTDNALADALVIHEKWTEPDGGAQDPDAAETAPPSAQDEQDAASGVVAVEIPAEAARALFEALRPVCEGVE